ncbi:hypothetical protein F5148DRAFT_689446 [Russula earlei]|uniref:Uncharacterized protein n=1 Tax=Russula earlei TaxID=71964 RepID=A0ACC0TTW6_9AGAM|nr:hypothetical protein F5148DRAFT_689446 [Russula earlei]
MTDEELASLELIIAQAWDQRDHQRYVLRHAIRVRTTHEILPFPPPSAASVTLCSTSTSRCGRRQTSNGQPLGEVASPPPPHTTQPRSSWATHRRLHSPSPRRILTNIRRQKQTISSHAFIARSSRRPFASSYWSLIPTSSCLTSSYLSSSFARHPSTSVSGPLTVSASPPTTLALPSPVTVLPTTAASLLLTAAVSAPIP